MSEYNWMCLNKKDSEYASGPKYAKILNMTGFSICERYTALWICQNMPWQSSEYIIISKYACILSMQESHRVVDMPRYGWICLNRNMPEFVWIFDNRHGSE